MPVKTHGMSKTTIYKTWGMMISRCHCPNVFERYEHVKVCDAWRYSFETFYKDMGAKPKGKTLDRIDSSKGYFKDNCRWATPLEQARNTRGWSKTTSSKYKGVSFNKRNKKWHAKIVVNYKQINLGYFDCEVGAARAYNEACLKHHKDSACINKL